MPLKPAIGIIWKELNKAVKYYSRITPQTKLLSKYLNNRVFSVAGCFKPVQIYNNTVYVIHVDYTQKKADYKPIISQQDIVRLYCFADTQDSEGWSKAFGFTKSEFMNLVDTIGKWDY